MMQTKTLRAGAAVAVVALTTLTSAAVYAKDHHMDGTFGWLGVGEITALERGHLYWTGQFSGAYTDKDPTSPLATTA